MLHYIWPMALVILSNVVYQICAKSVPEGMNPLASLTVTYLIGAIVSGVLYFALNRGGSLLKEYRGVDLRIQSRLAGQHGVYRTECLSRGCSDLCRIFALP